MIRITTFAGKRVAVFGLGASGIATAKALVAGGPSVPGELRPIVIKCLAKDPNHRYQSMREVALDLREVHRKLGFKAHAGGSARAGYFRGSENPDP